eukprot:431548_1
MIQKNSCGIYQLNGVQRVNEDFKTLQLIDIKYKYKVYGYLREEQIKCFSEEKYQHQAYFNLHVVAIVVLLYVVDTFERVATLGAPFWRHTEQPIHKKPQQGTLNVSFSADGKPLTLSWSAESQTIKMKDIWYISWGHYTPVLAARKNELEPMKCFSIIGHSEKQVLDLESDTKRDAAIWVKGLRKLIKQTDKKADALAEMNMQRLMFQKWD